VRRAADEPGSVDAELATAADKAQPVHVQGVGIDVGGDGG
jgi:hypothetical protein